MGDKREGESFRVFCYGGAKRFEVRRLGIRSFRCYREGEFEFGAGLNLVVGRNGVGKTSLLEAVCMVLRLQSPRSAKPGPCVAWGERNFCLEGDFVEIGEGGWERGVRLAVENGEDGRRLWIDGDCVRDSDRYLSLGRVVWFSGEDRELVRGSGTMRRRYLDFLCSQLFPGYLKVLRDYERALRSRNYLLRMGARRAEVEAFDEPLAGLGKRLQECRQWVMPKVKERADEVVRWLTDGVENVEVNYLPSGGSELLKRLRENYEEDQLLRMTTLGPHRDDFAVLINGRSAGDYASEGQQRTLSLGLRFAQAAILIEVCKQSPILLMDDVIAELDGERTERVLRILLEGSQVIAATAREGILDMAGKMGWKVMRLKG